MDLASNLLCINSTEVCGIAEVNAQLANRFLGRCRIAAPKFRQQVFAASSSLVSILYLNFIRSNIVSWQEDFRSVFLPESITVVPLHFRLVQRVGNHSLQG